MSDLSPSADAEGPAPHVDLTEGPDGVLTAPGPEPTVDATLELAAQLLRRLRWERRQETKLKRQAAAGIREATREWEEWLADRLTAPLRAIDALERSLTSFAQVLDGLDRSRRTWSFPAGSISARGGLNDQDEPIGAGEVKWTDTDGATFVGWCVEHARWDLVKVEPSKATAKAGLHIVETRRTDDLVEYALCTADGEHVPGVVVVKSTVPTYSVTAKP